MSIIILALLIFIAFTIGLNLGLHGLFLFPAETSAFESALNGEDRYIKNESSFKESNSIGKQSLLTKSMEQETTVQSKQIVEVEVKVALPEPIVRPSRPEISIVEVKLAQLKDRARSKMESSNVLGMVGQSAFWKVDVPIVLLTCNRPELLQGTIKSLLRVRGVSKKNILVSQDGAMQTVKSIVSDFGLSLVQNTEGMRLRGGHVEGAERIARHYKFSLSTVFDRYKDAQAVIVIEDDLLFSPDFYEYFQYVSPILQEDKSVFAVSAWNDNGFKRRVKDPHALRRTGFFPGLGWLLTRRLYKEELEARWPNEHWDHWLRSPEIHKFREIVHPEVPRTYHNGIQGTFMNLDTHNKYFRDIAYNTNDSVSWRSDRFRDIYKDAQERIYEKRVIELIKSCKHLQSAYEVNNYQDEIICIWINVDPDPVYGPPAFKPMAEFFGIWHEHKRGSHNGLHEFYYSSNYILILNIYRPIRVENSRLKTYQEYLPSEVYILDPNYFQKSKIKTGKNEKIFKANKADVSCNTVCEEKGLSCDEDLLQTLSDCQQLQSFFDCDSCIHSQGPDQPAYVNMQAPSASLPGKCLMNTEVSTCAASHPHTIRLCACSELL